MSVSEQDFAELLERSAQISALTETPGWEMLRDYTAKQLEAKQRALLGGSIDNIERYKFESGYMQGALSVLNAAEALKRQLEQYREILQEHREEAA